MFASVNATKKTNSELEKNDRSSVNKIVVS
jgi:hypothetical protein